MQEFVNLKAARRCPGDSRTFLVIGGGAAGVAAADSLRQEGYTGRLVMLSEEQHLPYDRPVLSKNLLAATDPERMTLRDDEHFQALDIEVRQGAKVVSLDAQSRVVRLGGGEELKYECALVA